MLFMVFYVGEITALVSLDIHKAVDSLSHSTLLRSLDQQFQPAHTCSIIRQIISDRSTGTGRLVVHSPSLLLGG